MLQAATSLEQVRRHIREGAARLKRQKALVDHLQHMQADGMVLQAYELYLEMMGSQMLAHDHYLRLAEKMLSARGARPGPADPGSMTPGSLTSAVSGGIGPASP